jgi:hypothetical protein
MARQSARTAHRPLLRAVASVLAAIAIGVCAKQALAQTPDWSSCTMTAAPVAAPPDTPVSVRGFCTGILYHRTVSLLFDGHVVAMFDGPGPDYVAGFTVPADATAGPHVVELVAPFARVSLTFGVTPETIFCAGDCDHGRSVEVNEVVLGVTLALDPHAGGACLQLDTDGNGSITVNELVAAVRNALMGCGRCHDRLECPNAERCVEPGGSIGRGTCRDLSDECTSDADCRGRGDRYICEPARAQDCVCEPGVHLCVLGCASAADCGPSEACDASFRCIPKPCEGDERGPLFSCLADQAGVTGCVRTPCSGDGVCTPGFCVNNRCYAALGMCSLPPP